LVNKIYAQISINIDTPKLARFVIFGCTYPHSMHRPSRIVSSMLINLITMLLVPSFSCSCHFPFYFQSSLCYLNYGAQKIATSIKSLQYLRPFHLHLLSLATFAFLMLFFVQYFFNFFTLFGFDRHVRLLFPHQKNFILFMMKERK